MADVEDGTGLIVMTCRERHSAKAVRLVGAVEKSPGDYVVILRVSLGRATTLLMLGLSRMLSMLFSFRQAISFLIRFTTCQFAQDALYTRSFR